MAVRKSLIVKAAEEIHRIVNIRAGAVVDLLEAPLGMEAMDSPKQATTRLRQILASDNLEAKRAAIEQIGGPIAAAQLLRENNDA